MICFWIRSTFSAILFSYFYNENTPVGFLYRVWNVGNVARHRSGARGRTTAGPV